MASADSSDAAAVVRQSICISQPEPEVVLHHDNPAFASELAKRYTTHESRALQELCALKLNLANLQGDAFWNLLSQGMADITGSQIAFVAKRILVDEQDAAVEMPPIGEPGACLMASALHFNDGKGTKNTLNRVKYHAYGCPCGYMRHDKVLLVPESLDKFIVDNPNELPITVDAYMGIPLFAEGKCFAHFGVLWSVDGLKARKLSWANVELCLHSLEDVILQRLLAGTSFTDTAASAAVDIERPRIIPHAAVTATQSLKPYARSLSHELRTPMQGVVGMLDVMYVTVLEAREGQTNPETTAIFETLKEHIEIIQDSSRRAVEAADNVVHAYDMDMHVPETAHSSLYTDASQPPSATFAPNERPDILVAGSNIPIHRPNKRRRSFSLAEVPTPAKLRQSDRLKRARKSSNALSIAESDQSQPDLPQVPDLELDAQVVDNYTSLPSELSVAPGLRHAQLRSVLQHVVNEGLKVGGRPESAIAREKGNGEVIEVRSRDPAGELTIKQVEWSIDDDAPPTILVDEKDLRKLVSCVFLNAIKFTTHGNVFVHARISRQSRHIVISVSDSGPGIDAAFLPNLFKPFSREDPSLTRQSEGLGLGLLVAKGIARRLGGDLMCVRTSTQPKDHGSEFEIRIPLTPTDHVAGASSPFRGSPSTRSLCQTPVDDMSRPLKTTPTPTPMEVRNSRRTSAPQCKNSHGHEACVHHGAPKAMQQALHLQKSRVQLPVTPDSPTPTPQSEARFASTRSSVAIGKSSATVSDIDRDLASKYPLSFLVAEDNTINRRLLVNMLRKFGYRTIHEAYDGAEAVRQMEKHGSTVDVILMDIWMPLMDGYEATEKILRMNLSSQASGRRKKPTVLAVTADVTEGAVKRAAQAGMVGFMSKPFRILDLQRLLLEYCALPSRDNNDAAQLLETEAGRIAVS